MSRAAAIPLPLRQNTDAWEVARQSVDFIGASDVPIITGSSTYKDASAYDLWAYKTGKLDRLPLDPDTEELFALGHAVEPVIAKRFTEMSGIPLRRVNQTLRHPEIEWAVASLDRISARKGDRLIVECKWDPWARYSREVEGVPPYVLEQVQWQLFVRGPKWRAEVAVLLGSKVSRFEVEPDPAFQDDLLFIVERFRTDHLLTGIPPEVDGSEATRKAIARLHPNDNGEPMDPTAELRALMGQLRDAIPAEKAASEEVGRLKNAIRSALGDHSGSESPDWRISFKKGKPRRTTDWKALANVYARTIDTVVRDIIASRGLPVFLEGMPASTDEDLAKVHEALRGLYTEEKEGTRPLTTRWTKEETQWS